jgi:hypothetical protein
VSLPDQLGRLRQVRRLGVGGFATVWLYRDDELDSDVAVKALADNWKEVPDVRDRFLAESRLLRQAQSDHLIQVHDIGVTDTGTPYFVMAYADCGSVGDLIRASRLGPDEVVRVVREAALGLAALHAHGIVHRDIKPENLLLVSRPGGGRKVVVADLGVAKALTVESGMTMHVGTPAYAAPEQADTSITLDPRADVYALGAVTYALICGHAPRRIDGRVEPLGGQVSGLPPSVEAVVMAALAPNRDYRWSDTMSYAHALADAVGGGEPHVPAAQPPTPAPTLARKRSLGVVIASAVAFLAVLAAGFVWWQSRTSGINGYEHAARNFVKDLQARDCASAAVYLDDVGDSESWNCVGPPDDGFDWAATADTIDLAADTRVEDLGDGVFRVVFVKQGYVLVRQRENSTMAVEGLIGGISGD